MTASTSDEGEVAERAWVAGHTRIVASVRTSAQVVTLGEDGLILIWEARGLNDDALRLRHVVHQEEARSLSSVGNEVYVHTRTEALLLRDGELHNEGVRAERVNAQNVCADKRAHAFARDGELCIDVQGESYCEPSPGDDTDSLVCSLGEGWRCATMNRGGEALAICVDTTQQQTRTARTAHEASLVSAAFVHGDEVRFRALSVAGTWDNPALPGFEALPPAQAGERRAGRYGPRFDEHGRSQAVRAFEPDLASFVAPPRSVEMVAFQRVDSGDALVARHGVYFASGGTLDYTPYPENAIALGAWQGASGIELPLCLNEENQARVSLYTWDAATGLQASERAVPVSDCNQRIWSRAAFGRLDRDTTIGQTTAEWSRVPARVDSAEAFPATWLVREVERAECPEHALVAELRPSGCDAAFCALRRVETGCVDHSQVVEVIDEHGRSDAFALAWGTDGDTQLLWVAPNGTMRRHTLNARLQPQAPLYMLPGGDVLVSAAGRGVYRLEAGEQQGSRVGASVARGESGWLWEFAPGRWTDGVSLQFIALDDALLRFDAVGGHCTGHGCGRVIVDGRPATELRAREASARHTAPSR